MSTGGWELRLYTKSGSETLIYLDLEGRKKERVFVKTQHSSEVVTLLSAQSSSSAAVQLLDIVMHCMTSAVKSFWCHVMV